jgi:hypothetical protein
MKVAPKENGNRMSVFSTGRKAVVDNKIAKTLFISEHSILRENICFHFQE